MSKEYTVLELKAEADRLFGSNDERAFWKLQDARDQKARELKGDGNE